MTEREGDTDWLEEEGTQRAGRRGHREGTWRKEKATPEQRREKERKEGRREVGRGEGMRETKGTEFTGARALPSFLPLHFIFHFSYREVRRGEARRGGGRARVTMQAGQEEGVEGEGRGKGEREGGRASSRGPTYCSTNG